MDLSLKYPPYNVRVKTIKDQTLIFDFIRKKWLALTPEEWVRQHLLNYLVNEKKYPASHIAIEREIILNDITKRFDVVVYNRELTPFILIECKAPFISLDDVVIEQVLRYNLVLKSGYVMITNGIKDLVFDPSKNITELPAY